MDNQKWKEFYTSDRSNTKRVFVKVMTTDGEHFFMPISTERKFYGWRDLVKKHCDENSVFIKDLQLQFRSHGITIDTEGADAVSLIRGAGGFIGGPTNHFVVIDVLKGGELFKHHYSVPELILHHTDVETPDKCNDEVTIRREKTQKNREKQVQT